MPFKKLPDLRTLPAITIDGIGPLLNAAILTDSDHLN